MKNAFVSATALIAAAAYSSAADCDISTIEGLLSPKTMKGLADCGNATGINIFSVAEFPTLDQVETLSENVKCSNSFNQINQVANTEIQCNITIEGVSINFGGLISSFLSGKTGNESDSGSGSIQIQLDDSMGSSLDYFASKSNSTSASSSSGSTVASPSQVLTFIAYGIAIAVGMCL